MKVVSVYKLQVCSAFSAVAGQFKLYTDREKSREIKKMKKPISTYKIKYDMFYVHSIKVFIV